MTNNLVYVGYVTGVFGIKGEVKCSFESNHLKDILKENNCLYINDTRYTINSVKINNNHYIIGFSEIEDISLVDSLLKQEIFINRNDFPSIDYFTFELFGLKIIDENKKTIGTVEEVLYNKNNLLIKTDNMIIPIVDKYVENINVKDGLVSVKNVEELRI